MSEKIQSSSNVLDGLFPVNMEIISVNKKAPKKKIVEWLDKSLNLLSSEEDRFSSVNST